MAARGAYLQAARKAARMTQAELAEAMGKSQALVSLAEKGRTWTGEPYRLEVLRACQLPDDWHP
jgi:transcriptional regulator with XRE-family HTH domain